MLVQVINGIGFATGCYKPGQIVDLDTAYARALCAQGDARPLDDVIENAMRPGSTTGRRKRGRPRKNVSVG